jgi:hypothetical protein
LAKAQTVQPGPDTSSRDWRISTRPRPICGRRTGRWRRKFDRGWLYPIKIDNENLSI